MNALSDIVSATRQPNIWLVLGIQDYRFQFGKAKAGLLWAIIQPAVWVVAIGFMFAPLMGNDSASYVIHVAFGIAIYSLLSGALGQCGVCFATHKNIIQNFSLPLFTHVLRESTRNMCRFAAELSVAVMAMIYFQQQLEPIAILALPGLALNIVAAVALSLGVSMLTVRWRDIEFAIGAVLRLMFFMTPILWTVDQTEGMRAVIAKVNPFTHFIEIVRQPMLGEMPSMFSYGASISITFLAMSISFAIFELKKNNIALWAQT